MEIVTSLVTADVVELKKLVEPWFKPNHKGDCSGVSIWFEFQFKLVVMFSHCSQEVSLLVLYINNMEFHKGIIAGFSLHVTRKFLF